MYTYQDYISIGEDELEKYKFMLNLINAHKNSDGYKTALLAQDYFAHRNRTINRYQKMLYTAQGLGVPDNISANHKVSSNFFQRFVLQQNQYLLGNGVTFPNQATKARLGDDFDTQFQRLGRFALIDGVSFGYWGMDGSGTPGLTPLRLTEFAPLYDEETGALMAGVRFWQLEPGRPIRATIYEIDGYTELLWKTGNPVVLQEKQGYIRTYVESEAEGREIISWENFPSFPIVPFWGNEMRQSEIVGMQEQIDCYDLTKSGFANDLDDASQIYWIISNAGGMETEDIVSWVRNLKAVGAASIDDMNGARAESHTIDVPYNAREAMLTRLRGDLYDDYMALDIKEISGGAVTATQVKAAYEPLNAKADMYEYQAKDFLHRLGKVIGEDLDGATFTRSMLANTQENINSLISVGQYLPGDYITRKVLEYLGDGDQAERVLRQIAADEIQNWQDIPEGEVSGDGRSGGEVDR